MVKKKKPPIYEALRQVRSDKTGLVFAPGDIVTADDFPKSVISGWLAKDPPVLKEMF